jgi:GNAT superfamily N-acetyltransferase
MDLSIVRADATHLTLVAPLFDAYRQFFTHGPDVETSERFIAERLSKADSVIFLARDGDSGLGFIQLYPLFSSWYARRIWFLSDLYVAEHARKRSVGRNLVQCVVEYAQETQAASVMVELPFSEPHLARFYGSFGFQKDDVFELFRLRISSS